MAVCDLSWPIIRCLVKCFNDKTLEEYISNCYKILSGTASDFVIRMIVHICLSHSMKMMSVKAKKFFKKREIKRFIMYCCSVFVNSTSLKEYKECIKHFFTILASEKVSSDVRVSITWFEEKMSTLGLSADEIKEEERSNENDESLINEFENIAFEDVRSCKRSTFYLDAKDIFDEICANQSVQEEEDNIYHSKEFLIYLIT